MKKILDYIYITFVRREQKISSTIFTLGISLLLVALFNYTFWVKLSHQFPFAEYYHFWFSLALLLTSIHYLLLTLLDLKFILKPIVIIMVILAALSAYVMDSYSIIIDYRMYQNILETDTNEIWDLITARSMIYLFVLGIIPTLLLLRAKLDHGGWKKRILHLIITIAIIPGNIALFSKNYTSFFRNHKIIRYYTNPITYIYSFTKFIRINYGGENIEFQKIGLDARMSKVDKKKLFVLVIGETARAHNFSLNGYKRDTNPLLAQHKDLFNFSTVYSCGTETSVSLPCMLSKFSRSEFNFKRGRYYENILDILKRADIRMLWRDNDSGCKKLCERIEYQDYNRANIKPFCNDYECLDEVLLNGLQSYIDKEKRTTFIVLHKKGNHGPAYYKRYPKEFEKFTPTCKTGELQKCTNDQIVNTYDNTILYTDFFLDKLIKLLKKNSDSYQTAMLYLSDHGESLGEGGIYLHAMPYWIAPDYQKHIPMIFWASDNFKINRKHLESMKDMKLSHDYLFHSILGVMGVQSSEYQEELDIFKAR